MPVKNGTKRWAAEDVAAVVIETEETDVTEEQIEQWSDLTLYEWLEAWGYSYNGVDWVPVEE